MDTDDHSRPDQGDRKFNLLGSAGYLIVLAVAVSGWSLSFRQLHAWGMDALGETTDAAWLIPMTYDLAPLGLSIVVYQMRRRGRSAMTWRLGIWAFTALSATINFLHAPDFMYAKQIAPLLPISAVVLFEGLMAEVYHKAMARIYGTGVVPRLTPICWLLDPKRTFAAFKVKALRPLAAAERVLKLHEPVPELPVVKVQSPPPVLIPPAVGDDPARELPKKVMNGSPNGSTTDLTKAIAAFKANPFIKGNEFVQESGLKRATAYRILGKLQQGLIPIES